VSRDVPAGATVISAPARILLKDGSEHSLGAASRSDAGSDLEEDPLHFEQDARSGAAEGRDALAPAPSDGAALSPLDGGLQPGGGSPPQE